MRFTAAIYFIVASGPVQPLLQKAGVGVLCFLAPRGSLALHYPYAHPRQGRQRENGERHFSRVRFENILKITLPKFS